MNSARDKPVILLTNDDGIDAEGMTHLRNCLDGLGRLYVCAPLTERSGASHAINLRRGMRLEQRERDGAVWGWALDGAPSDCVKIALSYLQLPRPDLVVSGINCGSNVGHSVYYSGTVGGAREAVMYGVPALAISMYHDDAHPPDYSASVAFTPWLVLRALETTLPPCTFLNVNVPSAPVAAIRGVAITRQGYSSYIDHFEAAPGPDGAGMIQNVGSRFLNDEGMQQTDAQALVANKISITPIQLDATHYPLLDALNHWLESAPAQD